MERFAWALRRPFVLLGRLREEPVAWRAYQRTVAVQAALTLVVGSLVFVRDNRNADEEVREDIARVSSSLSEVEQALGVLSLEVRKNAAGVTAEPPPVREDPPRGVAVVPPITFVAPPGAVGAVPPVPPMPPAPPVPGAARVVVGDDAADPEDGPSEDHAEAVRASAEQLADAQREVQRAQRELQKAQREVQQAAQRAERARQRLGATRDDTERAARQEELDEAEEALEDAQGELEGAAAELAEAREEAGLAAGEMRAAREELSAALAKAMERRRAAEARRAAMSMLERARTSDVDLEAVEDVRKEADLVKREALRLAAELRRGRQAPRPPPAPVVEQVSRQEDALSAQAAELKSSLATLEARLGDVTARWWRLLGFFLSALIIAQVVVLALSRDFQDRLARDLSLVAGVVPEDWPERVRVRLDMKWLYRKVRRRVRGLWVLVPSMILLSPVLALGSMVGIGETTSSLVLGAVTGYWWLVFTAARCARGWRFEDDATPPAPLRFAQKVVAEVPGFRWALPRGLVRFAVRSTGMMAAPARAVELDLASFSALGLLRLLTTVPVFRLGMRAAILVTTAEVLEGALPTLALPPAGTLAPPQPHDAPLGQPSAVLAG